MKATSVAIGATLVALGLISLSCRTADRQTPDTDTNAITKEFLIAHGFRHEKRDIYTRHYTTLRDASWDLGFSLNSLMVIPNGSIDDPDMRHVVLRDLWFLVTAEGGGSLDDPRTPCSVGVSLSQVRDHSPELATDAPPQDWVFMGWVREKEEWEESGTKWAAIDVMVDKDEGLLYEIRIVYNPADGVVARCCSFGKPTLDMKYPASIPDLISARERRRCRLVFTAPRWDRATIESEQAALKSLEWIRWKAPDRSADARRSSRSKTDATSATEESRRDGMVRAMESRHRNAVEEKERALSDAVLRRVARAYSLQTRKTDEEERKQEARSETTRTPPSATGRAVDRQGTPVAGAEVIVEAEGTDDVLGKGITDDNGHFAVGPSTTSYRGLTLEVTKQGYARWARAPIYGIVDYRVRMDRELNPAYLSDLVAQTDPERRLWMLLEVVGTRQMGFEIEEVYPFIGSLRPDLLRVIRSGLFKKDLAPVRARQLLEYWHDPADQSLFSNHWPADTSGETIQEVCKKYADYHFAREGVAARTSHLFSEPITGPDGKHALVVFEVRYLHWGYSEHLVLFHDGRVWKLVMVQHDENWEIERDF